MIFAIIPAGGQGSRMGNTEQPKQFLELDGTPIFIHAMRPFCKRKDMDGIVVPLPREWTKQGEEFLSQFFPGDERIDVIPGGAFRNDSIRRGMEWIAAHHELDDDTIIITHDGVRPFVTREMIDANIRCVKGGHPCSTTIPATDTIYESEDGEGISAIPSRKTCYQAQTPQSFLAKDFMDLYEELSEKEWEAATDVASLFHHHGIEVKMVPGETTNIKITHPEDLDMAESIQKKFKTENEEEQ